MTKVVVNRCYGGFGLSPKEISRYLELKGKKAYTYEQTKFRHLEGCNEYVKIDNTNNKGFGLFYTFTKDFGDVTRDVDDKHYFSAYALERDDNVLVKVVEELGMGANGIFSKLEVVEIPDDIEWEIEEYDGNELVAEKHRTW